MLTCIHPSIYVCMHEYHNNTVLCVTAHSSIDSRKSDHQYKCWQKAPLLHQWRLHHSTILLLNPARHAANTHIACQRAGAVVQHLNYGSVGWKQGIIGNFPWKLTHVPRVCIKSTRDNVKNFDMLGCSSNRPQAAECGSKQAPKEVRIARENYMQIASPQAACYTAIPQIPNHTCKIMSCMLHKSKYYPRASKYVCEPAALSAQSLIMWPHIKFLQKPDWSWQQPVKTRGYMCRDLLPTFWDGMRCASSPKGSWKSKANLESRKYSILAKLSACAPLLLLGGVESSLLC